MIRIFLDDETIDFELKTENAERNLIIKYYLGEIKVKTRLRIRDEYSICFSKIRGMQLI